MPALHLVPWDEERLAKASEHTGRKAGITAGSYIADLAALKKSIVLCQSCAPKFHAPKYGYTTKHGLPLVSGACDGCKDEGRDRQLFIHHQQMPR
jgi:hypothetical protein